MNCDKINQELLIFLNTLGFYSVDIQEIGIYLIDFKIHTSINRILSIQYIYSLDYFTVSHTYRKLDTNTLNNLYLSYKRKIIIDDILKDE